jgi:hypothetical protein
MTRGEKFAAAVREEYAMNAAEDVTIDLIAETIDLLDVGGLSTMERRQQKIVLLRALAQLALPEATAGEVVRPTSTSRKARAAAAARWRKEVARDA